MDGRRQIDGDLDRFVVLDGLELKLRHDRFSIAVEFEPETTGDQHAHRKAGRMVMVGFTLSDRPTTCSPTWLKLCEAPWRMA